MMTDMLSNVIRELEAALRQTAIPAEVTDEQRVAALMSLVVQAGMDRHPKPSTLPNVALLPVVPMPRSTAATQRRKHASSCSHL
jgi:hypothetical protein